MLSNKNNKLNATLEEGTSLFLFLKLHDIKYYII